MMDVVRDFREERSRRDADTFALREADQWNGRQLEAVQLHREPPAHVRREGSNLAVPARGELSVPAFTPAKHAGPDRTGHGHGERGIDVTRRRHDLLARLGLAADLRTLRDFLGHRDAYDR